MNLPLFSTRLYVATALAIGGAPALAQEKTVSGEAKFELHNDWAARADERSSKRNDMWLKIEAVTDFRVSNGLTLKTQVTVEPVSDPEPGKDRYFGDQGAFLQNVYLEYETGPFALRGGKFGQKFGIAWESAPGIWGRDFAKNYELAEQWGFAADYTLAAGDAGKHTFTAGSFFADTTVLSESVVTNRHRTRHSAGGAGNTEDFSNFSLALAGSDIKALPGLRYHFAWTSRDSDGAGEKTEHGIVGGLQFGAKFGSVDVTPLIEWAGFDNREGTSGKDANYLTAALRFDYGKWNLALARTDRRTQESGSAAVEDQSSQASVGYAFENGFTVSGGYRNVEESSKVTETLGLLVEYVLKY
jgi:hypothetical protein